MPDFAGISRGRFERTDPYSPWMKFCAGERCFVIGNGRSATRCGPHISATVERHGKDSPTLHLTVVADVDTARGLSIRIDQDVAAERAYTRCDAAGCTADFSGADLVDRLKRGHTLIAEAAGAGPFAFPLDDFAAAYDGPAFQLKVFEHQPGQLAKELQRPHQHRDQVDRGQPCQTK